MKQSVRNLIKRFYGPTGSIIIHLLLILLLVHFVKVAETDAKKQVEIKIDLIDWPKSPPPPELPKNPVPPTANNPSQPTIKMPQVPDSEKETPIPPGPQTLGEEIKFDMPEGDDIPDTGNGPTVIPIGEDETTATVATEGAVIKALDWLQANQRDDGSWDRNRIAMTGLALLTYLAHGETPSSRNYGKTIEKGLTYLLSQQREDGFFGNRTSTGNASVYAHAIAAYAISEAYGMTRAHALLKPMEKSIAQIVKGQQQGGGWYYGYQKGDKRDTSVAGWQIQTLKAAMLSGAQVPGLDLALRRAAQDMESVYSPGNQRFGYTSAGSGSMAMTGVGVLSLQLLGQAKRPEVRGGLRTLKNVRFHWAKSGLKSPLYGWYYMTQAKFHEGRASWDRWNRQMKETLIGAQASDGHWDFPVNVEGKPEHGSTEGPVYSTTLSTLMLEVYYRFLPTFKKNASSVNEEFVDTKDDFFIEIK